MSWWKQNKILTPEDAKYYRVNQPWDPHKIDALYQRQHMYHHDHEDGEEDTHSEDDDSLINSQKELLYRHLEKLNAIDRQIVWLRYAEGLVWREVAEHVGLSISHTWDDKMKKAIHKKRSRSYQNQLRQAVYSGDFEGIIKSVMLLAIKANDIEDWKASPRTFMEFLVRVLRSMMKCFV
jgi:hypothetical protein